MQTSTSDDNQCRQSLGYGGKLGLIILVATPLATLFGCDDPRERNATSPFSGELQEVIERESKELIQTVQLSTAFNQAMEAVKNDPQVIARLGEPMEQVSQPTRQGSGDLNQFGEIFHIEIKGPKGSARINAAAVPFKRKAGSIFFVSEIGVTFSDGSVVAVPVPGKKD